MRYVKLVLVLVTLVAAGFAQTTSDQPVNMQQVADRIVAQENALVVSLKDYSPIVETYLQELRPDPELGNVPSSDEYFLSRARLDQGISNTSMVESKSGWKHKLMPKVSSPFTLGYVEAGFLQGMLVDPAGFNRSNYDFNYVRREFLGDVRCVVFDVVPKNNTGKGRFLGRIWAEDQNYSVVRFTGVRVKASRFQYYFHFDSWRVNQGPNLWIPAYIYTEESDVRFSGFKHARLKAQTRFWGYDLKNPNREDEYSAILVDSKTVDDHSEASQDRSPLEAVRAWQQRSEDNVLEKLARAGLIAPAGNFEKVLDTVVNNLIVTNNLNLPNDVHCRVLLTAPVESLNIGHTIVISRGLIDTLPDEASLAMVLAHELGHVVLSHQLDTRWAFNDRVLFADEQTLHNLSFVHTPEEEAAADKKAMEILQNSPYKDKLAEGGLFLRALAARGKDLPHLISPHMGNRLALGEQVMRMQQVANAAPALDMNKPDQIAALPLGARLKLDPWSDRVEMMKAKPVAGLTAREKMPFEVTPFLPYLTRKGVSPALPANTAQITQGSMPGTQTSDAGQQAPPAVTPQN
ncbi:MAG: M48 family metalloprotease [Acidobacteria bacterium]|nr:M48 family metalloprotease [Acidobacteriota bacterium]